MKVVRELPEQVWDFIVGDDWRLAVAAVATIGGAAVLVALGINAWWWVPLTLAFTLWIAVR